VTSRPPARIRRRLLAFGVDYVVIAFYLALMTLAGKFLIPTRVMQSLFADPVVGQLSVFLMLTLPVLAYFTLMESSSWKGTIGKRALGLALVTVDHGGLSIYRALGRNALKLLPWELSHTCLWRVPGWPQAPQQPPWFIIAGFVLVWILVGAYILSALLSKRRQTLYDRLSRCFVVRATGDGPD
jgi:uncharacterized RDD family membrane protein YckC